MRASALLLTLALLAGCDTATSDIGPAPSPTAFQVRVAALDGTTILQRFTRAETEVQLRVLGAECGGASEYVVTARNSEGLSGRFVFTLPGDGTLPVVSTRPLSLNDGITAELTYTGPLTDDSRETTTQFDIERAIVAINSTVPPTIGGAIQVFGTSGTYDVDATVSFDSVPEFGCSGR